jgi:hypothetical protein
MFLIWMMHIVLQWLRWSAFLPPVRSSYTNPRLEKKWDVLANNLGVFEKAVLMSIYAASNALWQESSAHPWPTIHGTLTYVIRTYMQSLEEKAWYQDCLMGVSIAIIQIKFTPRPDSLTFWQVSRMIFISIMLHLLTSPTKKSEQHAGLFSGNNRFYLSHTCVRNTG